MDDFDVDDFGKGSNFIRKEDLADGPQRKRIESVEKRESKADKDGTKPAPELVLVFSDNRRFGLRAQANRDAMKDAYGKRTSGWIGKAIELYIDPTVRNPSGAKVGGMRLRAVADDEGPVEDADFEGEDAPF